MEKLKSPETNNTRIEKDFTKVGIYKGHDVYILSLVPKEAVANMLPDGNNKAVAITIRPDAYEILKSRPDYLERIYDHELQHNVTEDAEHGNDNDILEFLRDNGYDFGDFKIQKN
jgi:hypothetical protein